MSKKLFVGGLSWNVTSDRMRQEFEQFGEVLEAVVLNDRETGRSRGFGFVTFSEDDAAQKAIETMNGREIDGRAVKVDYAQETPRDGAGGGGGGRNPRFNSNRRPNNRW